MNQQIIPEAPQAVNETTYRALLPFWANNFAENMSTIRNKASHNIDTIPERKEPCLIIGGGPSLKKLGHLEMIKKSGWNHTVLSCDKVLADCLRKGIIPNYVGTVDASNKISGFYTQSIVRKYASQMAAIFPVYVNPIVLKTWQSYKSDIYWFTPIVDAIEKAHTVDKKVTMVPNMHSTTLLMYFMAKKAMLSGMGNVGGFLWNVAIAIKADPIILVGFDFSEQVKDKAEAIWFKQMVAMYMQGGFSPKKAQDMAADMHQPEKNPDFISNRDDPPYYVKGEPVGYLINPYWKNYRALLAASIVDSKVHTINATGGGSIHTDAKNNNGEYILRVPNFEAMELSEVLEKYVV